PLSAFAFFFFVYSSTGKETSEPDGRSRQGDDSWPAEVQNYFGEELQSLLPNRNEIRRTAMRSGDWQVVLCFDRPSPILDSLMQELIDAKPFDKELKLVHCDTISTDQLGLEHTILVANQWPDFDSFRLPQVGHHMASDQPTGAELSALPVVDISPGKLVFQEQQYASSRIERIGTQGPFLTLNYYPNPWSTIEDFRLMHLWYAPDSDCMAQQLDYYFGNNFVNTFWAQWAYQLETTDARYLGRYQDTSWTFDEPLVLKQEGEILAQNRYWKIEAASADLSDQAFNRAAAYLDALPSKIEQALPELSAPDEPIDVKLYASVERIGLQLGEMDTAIVDQAGMVHLVINEQTFGERSAAPVYALLNRHESSANWGENEQWGRALSLSPEGQRLARYLPAAQNIGLLRPSEEVRADRAVPEERSAIFLSLEQLALFEGDVSGQSRGVVSSRRQIEDGFQKGMTFAHEGYRVYNGYGGSTVDPSLDSLSKLRVNSLAIVPYSFMRDPRDLGTIPVADFPGGENDAATLASAKAAHRRGWSVMLKPQIWLGGGSWPGDIIQDSEAGWQKFFNNYREWILHYAILADFHGIETFCLGTEMRHTTLQRPEDWKTLIAQARQLFGGTLTYAANWGEEAEQMSFWSEFDVIGVNAYYPLSDTDEPSDEELQSGVHRWLERIEAIAEAADRPFWLTEIGYRSVSGTWKNPHAEPRGRAADEKAQMRAFSALCTVLEERGSVSGMYIWKWPSHLSYMSRRGDTGFAPTGKSASEIIRAFYR
ncbi:MAG: glycoside hydrolase TIM-barrel-like domain-containing protein, partial [Bacteroidota bacterium]